LLCERCAIAIDDDPDLLGDEEEANFMNPSRHFR
jgi:hypothetical protein